MTPFTYLRKIGFRLFLIFIQVFLFLFAEGQAPIPVSVSDFCNGSTKSLDSYLPAGSFFRTYSWTTSSINNVRGYTSVAAAQSSITQTLNLNTSLTNNGSIIYNIITSDGFAFKMTVTVLPTPYIANRPSASATTGCGSVNISGLIASVSTPSNGWLWTRAAVLGTLQQSGNINGVLDNLIDTTTNQDAVKYAFAITAANGCVGNDTITYTVLPTPFITNVIRNDSICSGLSYILNPTVAPLSNSAGGAGTYFAWTNPSVTAGLSGYSTNPTSTTTNFVQTLNNNTSSIITTAYSLIPSFKYSTTTCVGPSYQVYLSVNPRPYLPTPISISSCTGVAFSYSPTDGALAGTPSKTTILPSNTQFTWAAPIYSDTSAVNGGYGIINTAPPNAGSAYVSAPISQTLNNKSLNNQTAKYSVYATSTYGTVSCSALAPFDLIVTVKSAPNVNLVQDTFAVCSGSAPVLPNISGVSSYSWGAPQISPANSLTGATGSGSGNSFSPILSNTTTTSVIANYTLIPYSPGNCAGNPFPVVLNINPVANISTQNLSTCSGNKFSFTPPGVPQNTTYTWSSPYLNSGSLKVTGSSTNLFSTGDSSISATINYYGTDSGSTATFTITPRTGNCLGTPFLLNSYVKPLPYLSSASTNVCSGSTFSYTPTSNLTQVSTSYTWSLPVTTPDSSSVTGATNNNAPRNNISQTLSNSFNLIEQTNYTIIPTANGCTGPSFSLVANVNPTPSFTNKDTVICSGYPFSINPSPLPYITSYTWEAPVYNIPNSVLGGYSQSSPLSTISQVLTNTNSSLDVLATYKVTPSFNNCVGNPFKLTVTVKASPYITDTIRSVVCSDNAFTVKLPSTIPASTQFIWDNPTYSNGVTGGFANNVMQKTISQTLKNINSDTTTGYAYYSITPIANGCYGLAFPLKVSVKTSSASLISPATLPSICSGTNFTYTPVSNFPGTAFSWVRDSVPGIANPSKDGFADINEVLTDTTGQPVNITYKYTLQYNGCANLKTQFVTVTVKPIPSLVSPSQGTPICSGNTFNYIPISNTLSTGFNWRRSYVVGISEALNTGSNSISESLHNTTLNQVQVPYVFSLSANGCTNEQTIYETVNPVLQLNDQLNAVCSGSNFQITPPNTVNATFLWNAPVVGNGIVGGAENTLIPKQSITGSLTNLADTPNVANYTIIPYIPGASTGNCAGVPFNIKIIVNPIPILSSSTILPDVCSGTNFNYLPTSKTPGTIFSWTRDNISGISNAASGGSFAINETLTDTTVFPVTINYKYKTTYNGCTDSSKTVSFTLNPSPLVANQNITICSNTSFSVPTNLEPSGTTYTWNTPTIIPNNNITGASTQTIPQTIVSETLNNTSLTNATAIYTIQPQYPLCQLKPFTATITVKPISLSGNQTATVCNNKLLNYVPVNVPVGTQFRWVFSNPNPPFSLGGFTDNDTLYQNSIKQTITNAGNSLLYADYLIKPITNGCTGNFFGLKVAVNPSPTVQVNTQPFICQNAVDTVTLNFTGTSPWAFSYFDNKNNTLTTINGITQNPYSFVQPNLPVAANYTFNVLHLNDAYCNNDTSFSNPSLGFINQVIKKLPADSILAPSGNLICIGSFQPMQINKTESSYQWYFNGNAIANGIGINYNAYSGGLYSAKITDSFGCVNNTLNNVVMYDLKTFNVNFTTDSSFCINTPKQFINLTDTSALRNISWKWDFNGEDSSTNYSALTSFKKAGTKKVTLYAKIPTCTYSVSKDSIMVFYAPVPNLVLPTVTTNSGRSLALQARHFEGAPYQYKWQPQTGLSSNNIYNPVFNYFRSQDFFIQMTSPEGCITTDTLKVRVFDSALVDIVIPKSFTPNGDGNNDILYAYMAGISNLNFFKIFNKYGKLLFETRNPAQGWDGNSSGTKQPMDVYVWIAEGIDNNGNVIRRNGNVLLIR